MTEPEILKWDEWEAKFKPILNPLNPEGPFDGFMFETYGEELEFLSNYVPSCIWTLVEDDDGDIVVVSGWHFVNRLGYIVTLESWTHDVLVEDDA
jgi:hypothetical protein